MNRLTVTPIDLIYMLSGLTGFIFSVHALPAYCRSLRAARRLANPDERRDAVRINMGILTRECSRCTIHLLGVTVGVAALFYVPVHRVISPYDHAFGILLDAILLWANIATTLNTIMGWMEYCTIRERHWFESSEALALLRARIARREQSDQPVAATPVARDAMAHLLRAWRTARRRRRAARAMATAQRNEGSKE